MCISFIGCGYWLKKHAIPRVTTQVAAPEQHATRAAGVFGLEDDPDQWRAARGAWPLHARIANWVLARELRRRTGVALEDIGPMRAARRQALLDLDLRDRRSGWPLEMVVKAVAAGWSVVDAPVPYSERQGRSKVTGTVRGTIQTIGDMGAILRAAD